MPLLIAVVLSLSALIAPWAVNAFFLFRLEQPSHLTEVTDEAKFDAALSDWGVRLPCDIARQDGLLYRSEKGEAWRTLDLKFSITEECLPLLVDQFVDGRGDYRTPQTGDTSHPDFPDQPPYLTPGWQFDPGVTYRWYTGAYDSVGFYFILDLRTSPWTAYYAKWVYD